MDQTKVGGQSELKTATKRNPMHGCNDGYGKLAPLPDDMLHKIGQAMTASAEIDRGNQALAPGERFHPLDVETGAKTAPFARDDDGSQALRLVQGGAGLFERVEHGRVERVKLVRPRKPDVGDAVFNRYANAVIHGVPPIPLERSPTGRKRRSAPLA